MEQAPSRGHKASPQSGLGVGCKRCFSSKELRWLSVRANARRISTSLSFSAAVVSRSFVIHKDPSSWSRSPPDLRFEQENFILSNIERLS